MSQIMIIILSLQLGLISIVMFIRERRESREIFLGHDFSRRKIIRTALLSGLALNLGFLALELFIAGLDKNHDWSLKSIFVMVVIPFLGNVIISLGSIWRFYIVGKYRGFLITSLSKKSNEKTKN